MDDVKLTKVPLIINNSAPRSGVLSVIPAKAGILAKTPAYAGVTMLSRAKPQAVQPGIGLTSISCAYWNA